MWFKLHRNMDLEATWSGLHEEGVRLIDNIITRFMNGEGYDVEMGTKYIERLNRSLNDRT